MKVGFRHLLFDNLPYKITAIALSCLLWYVVQGEEILEINKRIAVNLVVPEGYTVKGPLLRYKDATLRGSRLLVGRYKESKKPIDATIKIATGKSGQLRYRVDRDNLINFDPRITLSIHDPYMVVTVDEIATKKIPVREVVQGAPAPGYMLEQVVLEPETVSIKGLKADLAKITQVVTAQIDITGLKQPKVFEVDLVKTGLGDIEFSTSRVTAKVAIGEQKINKRFTSIPVEVVGGEYIANVRPQFATIIIQGTPGVLSFIKKSDLRAFIDIHDHVPGRYDKELQVKIPPDTVIIETLPKTASVEIYNQKRLR